MAPLKGGTVADFSNSMGEAIDKALAEELLALKGQVLPEDTANERRMLLAAIGRGVLNYLKVHQDELVLTISADSGFTGAITFTVKGISLNIP